MSCLRKHLKSSKKKEEERKIFEGKRKMGRDKIEGEEEGICSKS